MVIAIVFVAICQNFAMVEGLFLAKKCNDSVHEAPQRG
jgi:hypothetical protein